MNEFFADTFYWIALCNPRDQWHERVRTFSRELTDYQLYTTEEVLTEFLTFFGESRPRTRGRVARFARTVLADENVTVMAQTHESFMSGLDLYESRLDKHYSLTDCISMQVMRREGLTDVLTNDRHFTQEGFRILFR
jgi:predicted nucleic acid-binding protein